MKKSATLFLKVLPVLLLVFTFTPRLKAAAPDIQYTIANDVSTSNTLEFDLLLLDPDPSQPFEMATVQAGIYLSTAAFGSGTVTYRYFREHPS